MLERRIQIPRILLGLMLEETGGVKVLEYNARLGDPEAQAILPLLETNIIEICDAILNGTLEKTEVKWQNKSAACVVLASQGYPQKPKTGDVIKTGGCGSDGRYFYFPRRDSQKWRRRIHNCRR